MPKSLESRLCWNSHRYKGESTWLCVSERTNLVKMGGAAGKRKASRPIVDERLFLFNAILVALTALSKVKVVFKRFQKLPKT